MSKISVLLEDRQPEGFLATTLDWTGHKAQGTTRQEALENLRQRLLTELPSHEIDFDVTESPYPNHPLLQISGLFKDDPQWDEFMAAIAAHRRELDAELAEEYRRMDESDTAKKALGSGDSAA